MPEQIAKATANRAAGLEIEPLTRRERDVLALLAEGLTSPEIADRLTLATSSVKSHMQHLYGKLDANSKRQVVARARELGLLQSGATAITTPTAPMVRGYVPTPSPRVRHNLPQQVTQFFGREQEIDQVAALVAAHRLVTLTGAGGVGKTRLAQVTAQAVLDDFPDGVWLVELAALSDAALVAQQMLATLSAPEQAGRSILANLTAHLRERETLIVLDNCEHLLEACARLVEGLLRACPRLRVLATSREALAAYGEAVFRVPSLPFPDKSQALDDSSEFASVSLFIDRARLVLPDYQLAAHNVAAVARICQRLDGIPLAIEMAAARVNLLNAEELAGRLESSFQWLAAGTRTALPRHKTLRATIDWSYQLLNEAERLLLQRLSIFAGGCTLEAAEAIGSGDSVAAGVVLDVLSSLVAKSMVIADRGAGQAARYRLLETIRQYAWEKLKAGREAEALRARHLHYFMMLAEEAEIKMKGHEQITWLDRLEAEWDNIRAAVECSQAAGESSDNGLRLVVALLEFFDARGHGGEARDWLTAGLTRSSAAPRSLLWARANFVAAWLASEPTDQARARSDIEESIRIFRAAGPTGRYHLAHALVILGILTHDQGDFTLAVPLFEESIAICRAIGERWVLAQALAELAATKDPLVNYLPRARPGAPPPLPIIAPAARNDHSAERALFEEALALLHELGDRHYYGGYLQCLAYMFLYAGDSAAGRALMTESLEIQRGTGCESGVLSCLMLLAIDALAQDDLERAATLYEECAAIFRGHYDHNPAWMDFQMAELARRRGDLKQAAQLFAASLAIRRQYGNLELIAASRAGQARLAWAQGDFATAHSLEMEILAMRLELGHPVDLGHSFHALAALAASQQQAERAARLFGAAEPYLPALYNYHRALPIWRQEREASLASVRERLGEAEMVRLWAEGEAMTLEQAVAYALNDANDTMARGDSL